MKLVIGLFLVLTFIGTQTGFAQSPVIIDGGFGNPPVGIPGVGGVQEFGYTQDSGGNPTDYLNGGNTGWYVSLNDGTVALVNSGIIGALTSSITGDGTSQYLALNGLAIGTSIIPGTLGGISQVITTVPGHTYQVSYIAGALSLGAFTSDKGLLSAGVDGLPVTSPEGTGAVVSLDVSTFAPHSFTFTANSTQSTLDFNEPSRFVDVGGVAIDGVTITEVPEPSDTAGLLLGFALAILFVRRLRSKPAVVA